MTTRLSKTEKLINVLSKGKGLTAEQLEKKTGLMNVSAAVRRLREEGFRIYTNPRRDSDGNRIYQYRMSA